MSCNCSPENIPITATEFLAQFDEFACLTEAKATRYINYACLQFCGFQGMCEDDRKEAFMLATAHQAYVFFNFSTNLNANLYKSVKNKDEQIVYKDDIWDLKNTPYGQILQKMLTSCGPLAIVEGDSYIGFPCNCL
jgi:hypothetical protein